MVALLEKIDGSEGFHQIVDFLNASHIRFALSKNPTIYDSHIKQFWQTTTVNTLDNREQEITTTVDGNVKTVTIAYVRKYLKLADAGGLSSLPNTEFFYQLSLMGNMRRVTKGYSGEETPLFPTMLAIDQPGQVADEAAFIDVNVVHGGAATTVSSIDARHDGVSTTIPKVTTADTELNTASTFVSTASAQRHTDTTAETLMEIKKSAAKTKDQKLHKEEQARFNAEQEAEFDAKVAQKLQEELDAAKR
ncbi:hypothetical protein Tco_0984158 [Tanacetum coccineum]